MDALKNICSGSSLVQKDERPASELLFKTDLSGLLPLGSSTDGSQPLSLVDLHFSIKDLPNLDTLSKTDPMIVVYSKYVNTDWFEVGRTEIIKDDLNPQFTKAVQMDYYFERSQPLRIVAYDIDNWNTTDVKRQELIGECETHLAHILSARGQAQTHQLKHPTIKRKRGELRVTAEEVSGINEVLKIQFSAKKLSKKDWYGLCDPYVRLSRSREDGTWIPVWKSEIKKWSLNPTFKIHHISVQALCNGDHERPILVEFVDWRRLMDDVVIGQFTTTISQLVEGGPRGSTYEVVKEKHKKKKNYKNSGVCHILCAEVFKQHSFLDFITGGCEISMLASIDFTQSNGNPSYPTSLHYRNQAQPNEYQQAIISVGDILDMYDSDKKYPVFGFGAKDPISGAVSHCFPLNGNREDPEVNGIQGILHAYNTTLNTVHLFGPTCFAPTIAMAEKYASAHVSQQNQQYFVLLIITDGIIMDMDATIFHIVKASEYPLSIIIVGVGNEDFSAMNILDADDEPLVSNGKKMARDIVQFVPFRDFKGQPPAMLARAVLEEVPMQMVSYFMSKGIVPNPRQQGSFSGMPRGNSNGNFTSAPQESALPTYVANPPPATAPGFQ